MVRHSSLASSLISHAKNGKLSQVALQKALEDLTVLEPKLLDKACRTKKSLQEHCPFPSQNACLILEAFTICWGFESQFGRLQWWIPLFKSSKLSYSRFPSVCLTLNLVGELVVVLLL